jgi:hypothetical protein
MLMFRLPWHEMSCALRIGHLIMHDLLMIGRGAASSLALHSRLYRVPDSLVLLIIETHLLKLSGQGENLLHHPRLLNFEIL